MIMKQTLEEAAHSFAESRSSGSAFPAYYAGFVAGAEWQSKQSLWISVEDAIPNKQAKGMCQVKYVDGSIDEMAMREVNKWIYPYIKTGYVTHWMPIPSFDEILEANKDVLEYIKEIENMKGNIFDKIRKASNKYIEYMIACDDVAKEAQKYIDWDDNVSCEYYPADGICIMIEEHVCYAAIFFDLVEESENGMIDRETFMRNCI